MKLFWALLFLILAEVVAVGATSGDRLQNTVKIGDGATSTKTLEFETGDATGNGKITAADDAVWTFSTATLSLVNPKSTSVQSALRFKEASGNGANYVGLKAPATLAGDFDITLPAVAGTADQMLGQNSGATALEWKTIAVGTSGTDFAVANSTNTVTLNLPSASSANRGVVTTGAQGFTGAKDFLSATTTAAGLQVGSARAQGNCTSLETTDAALCSDSVGKLAVIRADIGGPPTLSLAHARGSVASPTIINSGEVQGRIAFDVYDGVNMETGASIVATTDATPGSDDVPTKLTFNVAADGGKTLVGAVTINSNSKVDFADSIKLGSGGSYLNWYEESTFTPTLTALTTGFSSVTYSVQVGKFTRIGNIVYFTGFLQWTNTSGTPSGTLQVDGLPYTSKNTSNLYPTLTLECYNIDWPASRTYSTGEITPNTTKISLFSHGDGLISAGVDSTLNGGAATRALIFSGFYFI